MIWAFLPIFEAILAKNVSKKPISCKFGRKASGTSSIYSLGVSHPRVTSGRAFSQRVYTTCSPGKQQKLFAGVGAPEHFFAESGKEVTFGGLHDADLEGGAADFDGGVLGAAEAVSVY